jgi:hypothetical protein
MSSNKHIFRDDEINFKEIIYRIKKKKLAIFFLIAAFSVSGLFNFSARHFIFWLDISFLFQYVYLNVKNFKSNSVQST